MSTTTTPAPPATEPATSTEAVRNLVSGRLRGLRSGELGAWPVIIGLVIIWLVFQGLNGAFLTPGNLELLAVQNAPTGVISIGIVLVLLLGEIDLSVGSVAGVGAAALVVLSVRHGWPDWLAMIVVILLGALIGLIQGFFFAKVGVPAFVVTLAGNLGWAGFQIWVMLPQGTINIPDNGFIASLTHQFLADAVGWILGVVVLVLYALSVLWDRRRRLAAGLATRSTTSSLVRVIGLGAVIAATVAVLNEARGVPVVLVIFVGLVAVMDLVLRRTRYGRKVFAVGGNVEASRRAGINVAFVRMSVFMLCSTFAAFGGVLYVSRGFEANQSTGAADTLLIAIAGAVIGGVSLFGGRGSTYGALLGALVLGSISSGMLLLSLDSSVRYMITAAVLLAAVVLDSLSRRGRRTSGRA